MRITCFWNNLRQELSFSKDLKAKSFKRLYPEQVNQNDSQN